MPTTDKALKLSRLKLRSDQLVEIHLDKIPEPPETFRKLPGAEAWFQQWRLKGERDQQALHRMLTQINGNIAQAMTAATAEPTPAPPPVCTTLRGPKGDKGDKGDAGVSGTGDAVLTWMNL